MPLNYERYVLLKSCLYHEIKPSDFAKFVSTLYIVHQLEKRREDTEKDRMNILTLLNIYIYCIWIQFGFCNIVNK
jgi:cell division protein FtsW (lipid II flippase)